MPVFQERNISPGETGEAVALFASATGLRLPGRERWGRLWQSPDDSESFLIELGEERPVDRPPADNPVFSFARVTHAEKPSGVHSLPETPQLFLLPHHGLVLRFSAGEGLKKNGAPCLVLNDAILVVPHGAACELPKDSLHSIVARYWRDSGRQPAGTTELLAVHGGDICVVHVLESCPVRVAMLYPGWLGFSREKEIQPASTPDGFVRWGYRLFLLSGSGAIEVKLDTLSAQQRRLHFDPRNPSPEYIAQEEAHYAGVLELIESNRTLEQSRLEEIAASIRKERKEFLAGRGKDSHEKERKAHRDLFGALPLTDPDAVTVIGTIERVKMLSHSDNAESELPTLVTDTVERFLLAHIPHAFSASVTLSHGVEIEPVKPPPQARPAEEDSVMAEDDSGEPCIVIPVDPADPVFALPAFKRWNGTRGGVYVAAVFGDKRIIPLGSVPPKPELHEFVFEWKGRTARFSAAWRSGALGDGTPALVWKVYGRHFLADGQNAFSFAGMIPSALRAFGVPEGCSLPGDRRIVFREGGIRSRFPRVERTFGQWRIDAAKGIFLHLPISVKRSREEEKRLVYPQAGEEAFFQIAHGDDYVAFFATWTRTEPGAVRWLVSKMLSWPEVAPDTLRMLREAIAPALRIASDDITGACVRVDVVLDTDDVAPQSGFLVVREQDLPEADATCLVLHRVGNGFWKYPVAYDRIRNAWFGYQTRNGYDPRENTPEDGCYWYKLVWLGMTIHVSVSELSLKKDRPALTLCIPANLLRKTRRIKEMVDSAFAALRGFGGAYSERVHPDAVFSSHGIGACSVCIAPASMPGTAITARTEAMNHNTPAAKWRDFPPDTPVFFRFDFADCFAECEASYRPAGDGEDWRVEWTVRESFVCDRSEQQSGASEEKTPATPSWMTTDGIAWGLEEFTKTLLGHEGTVSVAPFTAMRGTWCGLDTHRPAFSRETSNVRVEPFGLTWLLE